MKLSLFLWLLATAIPIGAQIPDAPKSNHDTVAPWSINFSVVQRYINAPSHLGTPGPGMPNGRFIGSNHLFDNQIGMSLTESLAHNRIFWSLGYAATLESANQSATFSVGFRAFEFGRRR